MQEIASSPLPEHVRYVRPGVVGQAVGRSRQWAYGKIADGELRAYKMFGVLRVRFEDAVAFIERNAQPHEPPQ